MTVPGRSSARARVTMIRLRALWAFFEWDRSDLIRAALIGAVVFAAAATTGASALERTTASPEVRATRTLDQHTGHHESPRPKAPR